MVDFQENGRKNGPTHVGARIPNFFQDFFRESDSGHFFCPFFEKADSPGRKNLPPLLKKFLPSQT
jgi:hypothetical protein